MENRNHTDGEGSLSGTARAGGKLMDMHADDFGLSAHNAERILALLRASRLDSISILPNLEAFSSSMKSLSEAWDTLPVRPLISVHLNIADGRALSGLQDPFFTHPADGASGEERIFHTSWGRLFLLSFLPRANRRIRRELTREFAAQIQRVWDALPAGAQTALRLDSHTHTHMIPVVFDAMLDAVRILGLADRLTYVRVAREPLWPFRRVAGTWPAVNLVKNLLLGLLSGRAEKRLDAVRVSHGLVWGLIMSGRMDDRRVKLLMPEMEQIAARQGRPLELICHPGRVLPEESTRWCTADDARFIRSENRDIEYAMADGIERKQE